MIFDEMSYYYYLKKNVSKNLNQETNVFMWKNVLVLPAQPQPVLSHHSSTFFACVRDQSSQHIPSKIKIEILHFSTQAYIFFEGEKRQSNHDGEHGCTKRQSSGRGWSTGADFLAGPWAGLGRSGLCPSSLLLRSSVWILLNRSEACCLVVCCVCPSASFLLELYWFL